MNPILVFRTELLPISETFISAQASALCRFDHQYVGVRRASPSLPLDKPPILVTASEGRTASLVQKWFKATGIAPRFHARIAATKPVLLHAHFATDATTALPILRHLNIPLVVTLHGIDITTSAEALKHTRHGRRFLQRKQELVQRTNLFLCVSEFIRKTAIERGLPEEKLLVHHIGIDRGLFTPRGLEPSDKQVLFVGRLTEKKGCRYLIEAMSHVQAIFPEAKLVVIGNGPLRPHLELLVEKLGVRCEFRGGQPQTVIKYSMWEASVVVFPSVTAADGDSEGLGMVLLEAQASGLPVIANRHGGIVDVVQDGVNGALVPERDVTALSACIVEVLKRPDLRMHYVQNGLKSVQESFDLKRQTTLLEDIYCRVIERHALLQAPAGRR